MMKCWLCMVVANMRFHKNIKIGLHLDGTHGYLKKTQIWNFCFCPPAIGQTFVKSLNAGQKSGYHQIIILPNFRSVAINHHSSVSTSATLLHLVTVSTTTAYYHLFMSQPQILSKQHWHLTGWIITNQ